MTEDLKSRVMAEIISDAEVSRVHGNSNFGGMSPRDVLADGVLKYAMGYSGGHTQLCILLEHKLIRKPKPGRYFSTLTKLGQKYLRAAWPIAEIRGATPEALAASPEVAKLVAEAEARADKSHEKEIAVWSENYAALERDRNKWFEGAGAHHVASMKQAQRADRAEAALCAAQQRIKLLCDNDEWNLGLQEALEAIRAEAAAIRETKT